MSTYIRSLYDTLGENIQIRVELDQHRGAAHILNNDICADINVITHRRGKGAAITDGWEAVNAEILAFADADGSTPATEIRAILQNILTDKADLSIGSRRHPDATVHTNQTYGRRFTGDAFARLARSVLQLDIYDYQCGAKAISSEAWERVRTDIHESGFAWDIELIAMANARGLRIKEVPIDWYDKPGSTVAPVRTSLDLLRALVCARYRSELIYDNPFYKTLGKMIDESPALVDRE